MSDESLDAISAERVSEMRRHYFKHLSPQEKHYLAYNPEAMLRRLMAYSYVQGIVDAITDTDIETMITPS